MQSKGSKGKHKGTSQQGDETAFIFLANAEKRGGPGEILEEGGGGPGGVPLTPFRDVLACFLGFLTPAKARARQGKKRSVRKRTRSNSTYECSRAGPTSKTERSI